MTALTQARNLLDTRDRITSLEARSLGEELADAVILEAHSVSLSDEDIQLLAARHLPAFHYNMSILGWRDFARAIESHLKGEKI